jgi:hydrogenase maturation protease
MPQKPKYLVLAWGNPGRGDDGAGLVIAESLEGCVGADVTIRCFHQLGPELAEDVAAADHVIFIDAHMHPTWPDLVCRPVDPAADYTPDSHSSGPEELIALAQVLYHRRPTAHLVATRAYDTTFGAALSAKGKELVAAARKVVLGLLPVHEPESPVQP